MREWVLAVLILVVGACGGAYVQAAEDETAQDPMLECAETIAKSLRSRPLRIQALARLSAYHAEAGDKEKAEAYFTQARDFADELPFTYRDSIWQQISTMFLSINEFSYALDSARLMGTAEERLGTVSHVTRVLVNNGPADVAEAAVQRLLDQAKDQERATLELTGLMLQGTLNARKGDAEAADMSYRKALKLAEDNEDIIEEGNELVLKDYVNDCPVDKVITTVKRFFHGPDRGRKLYMVGESCVESGLDDDAQKAFEESIVVLKDVDDPNQRVVAQAELAEKHAKEGREDLATRLIADAAAGLEEMMDPVGKDQARRALAVARAWTGDLDKGLATAETIGDEYDRSLALIQVAGKMAEAGSISRAREVAQSIAKEYERDKAFAEVAAAVILHQDYEKGKDLLRNKVKRRALKATVLVNAAKTLSERGEYELGLDAVAQIPAGMGSKDVAAEKVVEVCIEKLTRGNAATLVPLAERAIKIMGYQHRTWSPLLDLGIKCEEFGRYEDAVRYLEQLHDSVRTPGYKAISLVRQTRIYAKMGDKSKAEAALERVVDLMDESHSGDGRWSVAETALRTLSEDESSKSLIRGILSELETPYVKSNALIWMLKHAGEAGELGPKQKGDVQEILRQIENVPERMLQMGLILTAADVLRDNDAEGAIGDEALTVLDRITQSAEAARIAAEKRTEELQKRAGSIKLAFFTQVGCSACAKVIPVVKAFDSERPDVEIKEYEVTVEGGNLLKGLGQHTNLPQDKIARVPSIFSDRMGLVGMSIDPQTLKQVANSSTGKAPWEIKGLGAGASSLGFFAVILGGLLDGINPCAFTVWIFLIAYLGYLQKSKKEMAIAGLVFTAAVFVTYLAIGLGLRGILRFGGDLWVHFNTALQLVVAVLVLVLALLSFADGILASKGRAKESWLKLPDGLQSKVRHTISKRARTGLTVGGTLLLGVLVAAIEFPCTGQVYISILSLLQSQPFRGNALGWLILYNVCFVLPLLVVFVLTFYGLTSEKLGQWFKRHMAKVKFGLSGFFLFLFVIMVLLLTGVLGGGEMDDMQPIREAPTSPPGRMTSLPDSGRAEPMDEDSSKLKAPHQG